MTREDWMRDLRRIDEIALKTGEAVQELNEKGERPPTLWMIYWLSVAVWHLLDAEIRRRDNA